MKKLPFGFTLIELLIVVAIIAILAAIAVPNFLEAQVRSKVSRVKNDLRTVAMALESYRLDNNNYPWWRASWTPGLAYIYNLLTTPIAYTTVTGKDIFIPEQARTGGGRYYTAHFHYVDRASWEGQYSPEVWAYDKMFTWPWDETEDRRSAAEWSAKSYGPDMEEGWPQMDRGLHDSEAWPYDASNGTVSIGDIVRWGP